MERSNQTGIQKRVSVSGGSVAGTATPSTAPGCRFAPPVAGHLEITGFFQVLRGSRRATVFGMTHADQPRRCVYIMRSAQDPDRQYIGQTADMASRLASHNAGESPYTARHAPWQIVVLVQFVDERRALAFERFLKSTSGRASRVSISAEEKRTKCPRFGRFCATPFTSKKALGQKCSSRGDSQSCDQTSARRKALGLRLSDSWRALPPRCRLGRPPVAYWRISPRFLGPPHFITERPQCICDRARMRGARGAAVPTAGWARHVSQRMGAMAGMVRRFARRARNHVHIRDCYGGHGHRYLPVESMRSRCG